MIKLLFKLIAAAMVLSVIFFMSLIILKPQLDRKLHQWAQETKGKSFEVLFFDYGKSSIAGPHLILKGVQAQGVSHIEHPYFEPREFETKADEVKLGVSGAGGDGIQLQIQVEGLSAKGGALLIEEHDDHERFESVSRLNLKANLTLAWSPFKWRGQVIEQIQKYRNWIFQDQPVQGIEMTGKAVFLVDGWPITVRFKSVKNQAGEVHLEGNPEDLRVIAEMIEPKFTEADLQLAAKNLIKMPKLLNFRREAEMRAVKLDKRDPQITYDTFRHIFWSYWLTKAYGAEFARETTDAHEIGDMTNSEEESEKDRHHNALGIEYAERGMSESEVEKMIFEDSRIIRRPVKKPREIKRLEVKSVKPQEKAEPVILP